MLTSTASLQPTLDTHFILNVLTYKDFHLKNSAAADSGLRVESPE